MVSASAVSWADRQTGDIGGLHGTGLLSGSIIEGERLAGELANASFAASHIFIVGNGHIFEAIWPRISLSSWDVYDGQETRLYRLNVASSEKMQALQTLQSHWVGQNYDLIGVIGMGFLELERQCLGHSVDDHNLLASSHKRWCSELGTDYLSLLNVSWPDGALDKAVDPQQLVNLLESLCGSSH